MADEAELDGSFAAQTERRRVKRFHVSGFSRSNDTATWHVDSPANERYDVELLIDSSSCDAVPTVELRTPCQLLHARLTSAFGSKPCKGFDRVKLGTIRLRAGENHLAISVRDAEAAVSLYSVELIPSREARTIATRVEATRSDTGWMRDARYGLQFHWTSQSAPRRGPRLGYQQAVERFDVASFRDIVGESGAGYVILTTSHAEHYFPAPIEAIDSVLPDRTSDRDLVSEIADELDGIGVRLMLYYHVGHDHWQDPNGWWTATGWNDAERFFSNWRAIIGEVGDRYRERLAGWFFDDGMVYYAVNADFHNLIIAAKAGNPARVICYNPWIYPRFTDFQDFFCGEGYRFLTELDYVPTDRSGVFRHGPQEGLQAHTNFILESDWCHHHENSEIPPPRYPREEFLKAVERAIETGIVPSVNLEIYQDVGVSDESLDYLRALDTRIG